MDEYRKKKINFANNTFSRYSFATWIWNLDRLIELMNNLNPIWIKK